MQDFRFEGQGRAPKARVASYRGAAGAEGVAFGEGCPPPNGDGSVEWAVPLLRKVLDFYLGMVHFACILTHNWTVQIARINKVKACKKLRYRHQTVQSHRHAKN